MSDNGPEDEPEQKPEHVSPNERDLTLSEQVLSNLPEPTVEVLERLPPSDRETVLETFLAQSYQGPIPSPAMLRQYDQALPGLSERLIKAWEEETRHRREMEKDEQNLRKTGLTAHIGITQVAQRNAFILALILILGGLAMGYMGHTGLAGTILGITVVSVLSIYILGRLPSEAGKAKDEQEDKD